MYTLLSESGVVHVDFGHLTFTEFSMRKGDSTHKVASDHIYIKRMAKEHMGHIGEEY